MTDAATLKEALRKVDWTRSMLGHSAETYLDYVDHGPAYMVEVGLTTMRGLRSALAKAEAEVAELVPFDRVAS